MYNKKKIILVLLAVVSIIFLYSQDNQASDINVDSELQQKKKIEKDRIEKVNQLLNSSQIAEVDSLYKEDERIYFSLIRSGDKQLANFYKDMMNKAYRNVRALQDDLYYLDCFSYILTKKWELAEVKTADFLKQYPQSNVTTNILKFRKKALFELGRYEDYVTLVEASSLATSAGAKFEYAQALYNLERYDAAQQLLEAVVAADDVKYKLRALATMGLISAAKGKYQEAIGIFTVIEQEFPIDTKYMDFVILSQARLHAQIGENTFATEYYRAYNELTQGQDAKVLYELAVLQRKNGNLDKAKAAFEKVLTLNTGKAYYTPAIYNLVLIDQELNNGAQSSNIISSYQTRVDNYFNLVIQNRNLVSEIQSLRNKALAEADTLQLKNLKDKIAEKSIALMENQDQLVAQKGYVSNRDLVLIKRIEEKFITRNSIYVERKELNELIRDFPKDELILKADYNREKAEIFNIAELAEIFLSDIEEPTIQQEDSALYFSEELYNYMVTIAFLEEDLLDNTLSSNEKAQISNLVKTNSDSLVTLKLRGKVELADIPNMEEKLAQFETRAEELIFQEMDKEEKRQIVIDGYYDFKANKENTSLLASVDNYDEKRVNKFKRAFNKYNKQKLNIEEYLQFVSLESEFQKITKSYNDKFAQMQIDTTIVINREQEYAIRENLYNRINRFIYQHEDFENNYKLYFNMAELSAFFDVNNYQLNYNNYKKVLDLKPDFALKDVVIYNLAFNKQALIDREIGRKKEELMKSPNYFTSALPNEVKKTAEKYSEVIKNYSEIVKDKDSTYRVEAVFRLADLYYDLAVDSDDILKYIDKSITLFTIAMKIGDQKQQLEALYQRAWHYMAKSEYDNAMLDLRVLLENKDLYSEDEEYKYTSAYDVAAYSLNQIGMYNDTLRTVSSYMKDKLFPNFDKNDASIIYNKVLNSKKSTDEFLQVIDLYKLYTEVHPLDIVNPTFCDSIVYEYQTHTPEIGGIDSLKAKSRLVYLESVERYGYNSEWYDFNKEDPKIVDYTKSVKKGYEGYIFPELIKLIQENPSQEDISQYNDMIEEYANYQGVTIEERNKFLPLVKENSMALVNTYVASKNDTLAYAWGQNEIYKYLEVNPEDKQRDVLEQNAYSYAAKYRAYVDTVAFDSLQYSPQDVENIKLNTKRNYILAANRYIEYNTKNNITQKDDKIYNILYFRGLAKVDIGDIEGARNDFLKCDSLNISNEDKKNIYTQLALIYKDRDEIDTSNDYFARASRYASLEEKEEYEKAIYSNRKEKVKLLEEKGDQVAAAKELEIMANSSVATEEDKSLIKQAARSKYLEAGDYETAITRLVEEFNKQNEVDGAWEYMGQAIYIADSLKVMDKKIELEDMFISKFPYDLQTFVFKQNRINEVKEEGSTKYNPDLVASRYMELYDLATKDGDKLDIGENKALDFYYFSISYKVKSMSDEDKAEEWLRFIDRFPNYTYTTSTGALVNSIAIQSLVCKLYKDSGNTEKYIENAKKLFEMDPTSILYLQYAAEQIQKVDTDIRKLYRKRDWQPMLAKIEEFNTLSDKFINEGIKADDLTISQLDDAYNGFETDYRNEQKKKALLAEIESNYEEFLTFTDVDFNERVRVSNLTTWNRHLYKGEKRIPTFIELVDSEIAKITDEVSKIAQSELLDPAEKKEAFYKYFYNIFNIEKYASELIKAQVNKYVNLPEGQFKKYQLKLATDPTTTIEEKRQKIFDYQQSIIPYGDQLSSTYFSRSVEDARSIYTKFIDGFSSKYPKSDDIVDYLASLNAYEVQPKEIESLLPDSSWRKDYSAITESTYNDSLRTFAVYGIASMDTLVVENDINCPIAPLFVRYRIITDDVDLMGQNIADFQIFINDNLIQFNEPEYDGFIEDTLATVQYLDRYLINHANINPQSYRPGINKMKIKVLNSKMSSFNVGLQMEVVYNEEELFIYNNSQLVSIVSDESWVVSDSVSALNPGSNLFENAQVSNFEEDYYQIASFSSSVALPIWSAKKIEEAALDTLYVVNDSLNVMADSLVVNVVSDSLIAQTDSLQADETEDLTEEEKTYVKIFKKEFDLTGEVIEANLYFLAKNIADIYLNGEQIGFEEYYYWDENEAPSVYIDPAQLLEGKNELIFIVYSPTKDNGLVVDFKIKTITNRR